MMEPWSEALHGRAAAGEADACQALGLAYANGLGVERDDARAAEWLRKAMVAGASEAQGALASVLFRRRHDPEARAEGLRLAREAAEAGSPAGQAALGAAYFLGAGTRQDLPEALRWLRQADEQGCTAASVTLGAMALTGKGLPRDREEAFRRFTRAADDGYLAALANVGMAHLFGWGTPKDKDTAARVLQQAADRGSPEAALWLGIAYRRGWGVPRDRREALRLINQAIRGGIPLSWFHRFGLLGDRLLPRYVALVFVGIACLLWPHSPYLRWVVAGMATVTLLLVANHFHELPRVPERADGQPAREPGVRWALGLSIAAMLVFGAGQALARMPGDAYGMLLKPLTFGGFICLAASWVAFPIAIGFHAAWLYRSARAATLPGALRVRVLASVVQLGMAGLALWALPNLLVHR